jgi:hypothetical protein
MFNAHAAQSIRNFKTTDAALTLPTFGNRGVSVELRSNWLDAPSLAFYGVGSDSRKKDKVSFHYRATTLSASTKIRAARFVTVGAALDHIDVEAEPPSPGRDVALDPTYRRTAVFAALDWRTSPDYTRRGGLYRLEWSDYHQTNAGNHSFRRLDAEVRQFVPILRENWVIALRALASTTETAAGQEVPFFLLPSLGGNRALRGYSVWRFRDRNRLLLSAEYRWTAGSFVDMAVFVDAGKVTSRRADLNLQDLKTSHGLGMTIHTPRATLTRIEVARSPEGTTLTFSLSPSF